MSFLFFSNQKVFSSLWLLLWARMIHAFTTGSTYAEPISFSNSQPYIIADLLAFADAITDAHTGAILYFLL